MKTKTKVSIKWIAMTGAILVSVLYSNTSLYANFPSKHKLIKTDSEKIANQIDKITEYWELLKNAEEKKSVSIHRRIENSQAKIRIWQDELYSKANLSMYHAMNLPFIKYNFDVAENSLVVNKFRAHRNGKPNEFHLGFKTTEEGPARIDIVSPGGELLKSITQSNYTGSFGEEIQLDVEKGEVYFVHIEVDGKQTAKKLHFD